jgi:hypothetical protein
MVSQAYSVRSAIDILKQHRDKLEVKIGKIKIEQLLFNLEEINLDLESLASGLVNVATEEVPLEQLSEIFDAFQYGSIPHIQGHIETIEELLENKTNSDETSDKMTNLQGASGASTPYSQ